MKIWFTSFVLLFLMAEFFQWIKHFTVPLPVFILGGVLLAISSNSNKRAGFPFSAVGGLKVPGTRSPISSTPVQAASTTALPPQPVQRSISFVIPKPEHPGLSD